MYELYVENCRSQYGEAYSPVSSGVTEKITAFNMGFYKPKKDRCTECKKFELMSAANQEAYKSEIGQHLERHREAQTAKTNDTQRSNDEKNIQISDQSPLTCNQVFRYHHQMLL